jgi:UDP-glucuronate 4-epimerase
MKILVTGALGFIGFNLTKKLLKEGHFVVGIDNINSYYDVRFKYGKLPELGISEDSIWPNIHYKSQTFERFVFSKVDITDRYYTEDLMKAYHFDVVCNLAAQAGVQYSIMNPHTYIENNVTGFINLIDACRQFEVKHFVYASSSSVYGNRPDVPFNEHDNVDLPISLYAASKKSNELIAHTYSHLYKLTTTGLRFFTVYGPWGRPDMAPYIFVDNISKGQKINVFNQGKMERDFTYINDIVEGLCLVINKKDRQQDYRIYNIGRSKPVKLMDFIETIERILGKKADINYLPHRKGDVKVTYANVEAMQKDYGYRPVVEIDEGITHFIDWYKWFRAINQPHFHHISGKA